MHIFKKFIVLDMFLSNSGYGFLRVSTTMRHMLMDIILYLANFVIILALSKSYFFKTHFR